MRIDFTALEEISKPQISPRNAFKATNEEIPAKEPKRLREPYRAPRSKGSLHLLEHQREERQRRQEAYSKYQENIQRAGELRAEILKGIYAGEPAAALLLKALECIGNMTGDRALYEQGKAAYFAVHSQGLEDREAITEELREIQARLDKLSRPELMREASQEDQERIHKAIRLHREAAEKLKEKLQGQRHGKQGDY